MKSKKKISAVISLITAMPKGKFFPFKNGTWQTYDGDTIRGNLYLNGLPALNYYITQPGKMHIFFGTDNPLRISYEEFVFNGSDSIWEIASIAKTYAIAPRIASYLDELLQYIEEEIYMLRPSDFVITNFSELAQGQTALCVGVRPYKDYKDGIAGDICGYSYELVLPSRKYEHIAVKVPGSALINPELFSTPNAAAPIEQIQGFSARWYKTANMTEYALSCKASGFTISKEAKA